MLRLILVGLLALGGPAVAQEDNVFLFGGDAYASGTAVTVAQPGVGDVFAVGERVEVETAITGSAHLAGRRVATDGDIGGSVVAIGADVSVGAPVSGSVTAAGYDVDLAAAIGGNLRAMGRSVTVAAPVGGSALLSAETLTLDGAIGGDAAIDAETVVFGPGAKVAGKLVSLARTPGGWSSRKRWPRRTGSSADRTRAADARPGWSGAPLTPDDAVRDGWVGVAVGFAIGVADPRGADLPGGAGGAAQGRAARRAAGGEPARTTWIGFLTLSALLGACVVAVLTIVGVLAVPVILLAAMVLGLLGYLVGGLRGRPGGLAAARPPAARHPCGAGGWRPCSGRWW